MWGDFNVLRFPLAKLIGEKYNKKKKNFNSFMRDTRLNDSLYM